jgi:parvulin-like peptidyl-prolyl isomerase
VSRRFFSALIAALPLLAQVHPSAASEINRVILRVNDRIASLYDYESLKSERTIALSRAEMPEAQRQQMLATVGVTVMKEMFDEMLLLSRADQLGLSVDEEDVQGSMERTKAGFGISTDEEFDRALASNNMTRASFRAQIEKNLMIRKVMGREVYSQVAVEDEDLRRYYQQNPDEFREPARRRLREVVVLESAQSASEREQLARDLRRGVLAGGVDEEIKSHEQAGRTTGWIDLGWVDVGDLDSQLEESLIDLGPGSVSEPTAARGGLHLIEVVELQEPRLRPFNDVSADIERRLTDQRFAEEMDSYMRDLEKNAYIESDPPPEAAGFRSGQASERTLVDPLEARLSAQDEPSDLATSEDPTDEAEAPEPPPQ